jgi:hypothetical protein
MTNMRLDPKLLSKRPDGFVLSTTRPPLLSSATRLEIPGPPGCARLAGANASPPFGMIGFSYRLRHHSSIAGLGTQKLRKT